MIQIKRWPQTDSFPCGCTVSLKREKDIDVLLYFPCKSDCYVLDLTKEACEKNGKPWEERHVSNN